MRTSGNRQTTAARGPNRSWFALLLCMVALTLMQRAGAQQTILAPTRGIDWSKVGIAGGIPVRTTRCATLSPGWSRPARATPGR